MKTIIIAEKDQAAEAIANILGCYPTNNYWVSDRYLIVGARGHVSGAWLKGLKKVNSLEQLPLTDIIWRPTIKDKYLLLKEIFSIPYNDVIIATDYDREGEVM